MPRTIIVTGANSGIGRACAAQLRASGEKLVLFDRARDAIDADLAGHEASGAAFTGDISRTADCQAAVDLAVARFGRLDAVIHCAAAHSSAFWTELTEEEMNRTLAVNVTGSFLISQAAARQMAKQGDGGAIVLTSSSNIITGGVGGAAGQGGAAYVASKAAIGGLIRSLARSFGPEGVRINAVAPGVTETAMIAGYAPETKAAQAARHALGRIAEPDDIAGVLCFLVSDASRFMTGEMVIVNGGANFG